MKHLVNYSINIVEPNIFAVIIKDQYERAMTFCRVQEFYESPNKKFKNKSFSIWEYMDWYSKKGKKGFSYPADWSGFNFPVSVILDCYKRHWMNTGDPELFETPYDEVLYNIVRAITDKVGLSNCHNGYVIGTDKLGGSLFEHEICHAKYHTDKKYKRAVNCVTRRLKRGLPEHYKILKKNILNMGYSASVVDDEIQAYMQYGASDHKFSSGIEGSIINSIRKMYTDSIKNIKLTAIG
jgi:hypothetical protein